ncbi:MAG: PQQ-binding-like beta-propeller repeat protein [Planctomycetota bacterium]
MNITRDLKSSFGISITCGKAMSFYAFILAISVFSFERVALAGEEVDSALAKKLIEIAGINNGLCVHLGVTDGKLDVELGKAGKFLVHGLATSQETTDKARQYIQNQKLYGQISIERSNFTQMLYSENMVNLVIADDLLALLKANINLKDIQRVLCPKGVVLLGQRDGKMPEEMLKTKLKEAGLDPVEIIKQNGLWAKYKKPRPNTMDEWTHFRRAPDGNAVSQDSIAPPTGFRWIAGPAAPEGYGNRLAWRGPSAVVSANGRLFFVCPNIGMNCDDNMPMVKGEPIAHGDQYFIMARDAYNGLFLWKQKLSVFLLQDQVVATSDRLYLAALENNGPLTAFNSATGEIVMTYKDEICPDEIIHLNGVLFLLWRGAKWKVKSLDAATGKVRWQCDAKDRNTIVGHNYQRQLKEQWFNRDLMISDGKVFFLEYLKAPLEAPCAVTCLEADTGRVLWRILTDTWNEKPAGNPALRLGCYQEGRLFLFGNKNSIVHAMSAKDGSLLWSFHYKAWYIGPGTVFYIGGLLWTLCGPDPGTDGTFMKGLDPATGKVQRNVMIYDGNDGRCSQYNATKNLFLYINSRFIDIATGKYIGSFLAMRESCHLGAIPANGLIYSFHNKCSCYPTVKGIAGLAAETVSQPVKESEIEIERGPVYGQALDVNDNPKKLDEWPIYRHDVRRSGAASSLVASDLPPLWEANVSGTSTTIEVDEAKIEYKLVSAPAVARNKVFVAAPEIHEVRAFDAATGKIVWRYTAGGRIDTPPTIHQGLCLFGCNDGWIYCLKADEGKLVWRLRAAPEEKRIVVFGQLESPWPVSGTILVKDGSAYFAAGRHSVANGGMILYKVETATGKVVWKQSIQDPLTRYRGGYCYDILVGGDNCVYLGSMSFDCDKGTLMNEESTAKTRYLLGGQKSGLRDSGSYRAKYTYVRCSGIWAYGWARGSLLVFRENKVFGIRDNIGREAENCYWRHPLEKYRGQMPREEIFAVESINNEPTAPSFWSVQSPITKINAMALVGETVFVAGALDEEKVDGGAIWALSAADGKKLGEAKLAAPTIFDGMAAAYGRLYVSTQDGKLRCFGK